MRFIRFSKNVTAIDRGLLPMCRHPVNQENHDATHWPDPFGQILRVVVIGFGESRELRSVVFARVVEFSFTSVIPILNAHVRHSFGCDVTKNVILLKKTVLGHLACLLQCRSVRQSERDCHVKGEISWLILKSRTKKPEKLFSALAKNGVRFPKNSERRIPSVVIENSNRRGLIWNLANLQARKGETFFFPKSALLNSPNFFGSASKNGFEKNLFGIPNRAIDARQAESDEFIDSAKTDSFSQGVVNPRKGIVMFSFRLFNVRLTVELEIVFPYTVDVYEVHYDQKEKVKTVSFITQREARDYAMSVPLKWSNDHNLLHYWEIKDEFGNTVSEGRTAPDLKLLWENVSSINCK